MFFPGEGWSEEAALEPKVGGRYELTMRDASLDKVFHTLCTQAGYRGWWNAGAEAPRNVGGVAKLHFVKDGTPITMGFAVDELNANEAVRWTCTSHDMPSLGRHDVGLAPAARMETRSLSTSNTRVGNTERRTLLHRVEALPGKLEGVCGNGHG